MTPEHKEWLARPAQHELSKKLGWIAWILSAVVLALVMLMRVPQLHVQLPPGVSLSSLPLFHAVVNGLAAVMLMGALISVKLGRIAVHRNFIFAAMVLSILFLLSYVAYHFTSNEVKYGDSNFDGILSGPEKELVGNWRPVYLMLLISHITLAAVSLPFILFTFISGWTNRFTAHRRLSKFVFPMWLYVAVTGPICYWMLRPYYPG